MIKLSGYKILKKIGSGGMGDVYLAEHEKLEKKVAIKSLHKNLATDPSFKERFSQEAKTHSKLDHPNIVKLLDYKEQKDDLFLIMEYVDGKQLDEHIKKVSGPIPEKDLTALFTQLLDAIGYSHKKGLVHRDIKPSNIMIDKEGRIKVLDFGIAKMQDEDKGLTKTGVQIGTASYMSPEQVNAKKLDKLTDIYSLGVTLFQMAVGKSPYGEETNTFLIQTKIVSDPLPLASKIYPGVSERFEEIINKATQKKKKDRYQSCEDFKNDLNTIKKDKKIVKEDTNSLKDILKRKTYLIILSIFSILYIVTSIIDNNADRPDFLFSEFTVIAAFFVLVTLFSIKAVSIKYKLKKIIAREILYLICSFLLAVIMFGIHTYVYNSYYKTRTEMEDAISKCEINVSNLKSQEDYNLSNLSELGFKPLEKEYYLSDLNYLKEHLKKSNGAQFIYNRDLDKFRQDVGQNEYNRLTDQIGEFTQLSSITNNPSDRIIFEDGSIFDGESLRSILGAIKLKKKQPIYKSSYKIFTIRTYTTSTQLRKAGLAEKYLNIFSDDASAFKTNGIRRDRMNLRFFGADVQFYTNSRGLKYTLARGGSGYSVYFDKKKNVLVKTNNRKFYEELQYDRSGLGCSTWLCDYELVSHDYFIKHTPSNSALLESPLIIDLDDFDEKYNTSFYRNVNFITLEKDLNGVVINPKKDKIEASLLADIQPSFFSGYEGDWSLIILFLAYVYRAIISIITGFVFFIRWVIIMSFSVEED